MCAKVDGPVVTEVKNEKPAKIEIKDIPNPPINNQPKPKTSGLSLKAQLVVGFILFVGSMFYMISSIADKPSSSSSKNSSTVSKVVETVKAPIEHRNALAKAQIYSDKMYLSKKGLYKQLTSKYGENFSKDAAQYALDHVKADYKRNALKKAELYSSKMHMSRNSVYKQLVSEHGEQFTAEEAQYAVDHMQQ